MSVLSRDVPAAPARGMRRAAPVGRRAAADATVRLLATSTLWLSLLLVTYWWDADGGIRDLGGWATGLDSLGRLTGLVASVLLLAQVVLMARVPRLEAAYGQDRLAHLHRLVGFTSFNLMLAHIVLITWGYAAGQLLADALHALEPDRQLPRHAAGHRRHGLPLPGGGHQHQGRAAPDPLRVVAPAAPLRLPRRRPRPAAPAVDRPAVPVLPRPHVLLVDGVGRGRRRRSWSGGSACRCGATCGTGSRSPRWSARRDDVVSVYLTGRRLHRLRVEAGQFFTWRFLGRPGWTRANPYSLSAAPDGRSLRITVQAVGDGSAAAFACGPAPGCSSRDRTAGSARAPGPAAGSP